MWLAYDVETTGLILRDRPSDDPMQPRLVQVGAVMAGQDWREAGSLSLTVKPDGWTIPEQAAAIHGITTEHAQRYGVPLKTALVALIEMGKLCRYHVVYNKWFDDRIIASEIARLGSDDRGMDRTGVRVIDPMAMGQMIMGTGKWPKLSELHRELLGWDYPQMHDGLHDARAALRCARRLLERKVFEL